jgi:Zn finger protein HypA/HybF involved in hydrogenase expression
MEQAKRQVAEPHRVGDAVWIRPWEIGGQRTPGIVMEIHECVIGMMYGVVGVGTLVSGCYFDTNMLDARNSDEGVTMHTGQIHDSGGTLSKERAAVRPCPRCGWKDVLVQTGDSSCGGYEDLKYTCPQCYHVWWVDGIDS